MLWVHCHHVVTLQFLLMSLGIGLGVHGETFGGLSPRVESELDDRDRFEVPSMIAPRLDVAPIEFIDVGPRIPNYLPGQRWGTQGRAYSRMPRPLSPLESRKHYVTPVGFRLELFASEPELGGKPICMAWDERGRLWVCETVDYPNDLRPGRGRDRIRIVEDTDDDGRADRFTVFAEDLSIPTSLTFHRGGVIVQNGVETLYLKDLDGDDRADVRHVLISNWALGDTHGGVSNMRYGFDNWFYAMQGYNNSQPMIDGRPQQRFRMGFFRFRLDDQDPPHVTDLEFLRSTDNNTWGLGLSEEGLIFGSTANRNPSVFMPMANRYYERVRGWSPSPIGSIADDHLFDPITDQVRQVDHHGGYTAGAGHALYTARSYPSTWWNRTAFVCGPTGHLVGTFELIREGAGFASTSPCNLVASDDEWSAPIMAEVGPDGSVWILDWYNYIVQHNPTPNGFESGRGNAYVTDLRDKVHGRIYRLVYEPNRRDDWRAEALTGADPERLVEALTHPNMLWRSHAQRLLVERGRVDVVPALCQLVEDFDVDPIGLNVGAIHAIWTLHGLGSLRDDPEALAIVHKALAHPSAGVRRNAVQALPTTDESADVLLASSVLEDPDAQVRLAGLLALADAPAHPEVGSVLAQMVQDPDIRADRWLADANTSAAAMHALSFLDALLGASTGRPAEVDEEGQEDAHALRTVRIVGEHLARGAPDTEETGRIVESLAKAPPALASALLTGLRDGWPDDHSIVLNPGAEAILPGIYKRLDVNDRAPLVQLAVAWRTDQLNRFAPEIVEGLLGLVDDGALATDRRIEAAEELVAFRPDSVEVVEGLLDRLGPQTSLELANGIFDALSASTAESLAGAILDRSPRWTPDARREAFGVLLGRPEWTERLLDAVDQGTVRLTELGLNQRQSLRNHPDADVRRRVQEQLADGGDLPDPDRDRVLQRLLPLAERDGDPALGRTMFLKHCASCHIYGEIGQQIGPNLTGMAVHPREELLTHIIDPSRSVEGNYQVYNLITLDGRFVNGMLAAESRTTIELIDTQAKRYIVPRSEIDQLIGSQKSLMPEGFEQQMSEDELVALLGFLTAPRRFIPLPLVEVATAISTKGLFHEGDRGLDRIVLDSWEPLNIQEVPFVVVDPEGRSRPNIVLLNGPRGTLPPTMPRSLRLPVNAPAQTIHLLGGIGGWSYPAVREQTASMIVRIHYDDGSSEDHPLINGIHLADYIRRVDVPQSEFAFEVGNGQQVRYLRIEPERQDLPIAAIELLKGDDPTAPIVLAITVETPVIDRLDINGSGGGGSGS